MGNPTTDRSQVEQSLRCECSGEVYFDPTSRGIYSTDASIYQMEPLGVVVPDSLDDACRAVQVLCEGLMPILPRGGGTSLAGQCVNDAVVIDLSARCTKLIDICTNARTCMVEAGMTIDDLNDLLAPEQLFFAPDPSTARQANIGGCIGNNAAGVHSVLYGRTSDSVFAVEACLSDGERVVFDRGAAARDSRVAQITTAVLDIVERNAKLIRERFPKTMRRSCGYQLDVILDQLEEFGRDPTQINLAPLLCGSEGTLACTLSAKLLLHSIPKAKGLAVMSFESIEAAVAAVEPILDLNPSAVELLDKLILDLARTNTICKPYTDLLPQSPDGNAPDAVLYVEFFSQSGIDEVHEKLEQLGSLFSSNEVQVHTSPQAMADAWALRKAGEPLLHAISGHRKPLGFVEDNAVPVGKLSEFIAGFRAVVESEGTVASYYAHASVGVLHVRPLLNLRDPEDEGRMIRIAERVAELAKSLGGVPSGEHGDGRVRGPLLESYFGKELMQAFREVKGVFDPLNLMNPGNIVTPGPIESIARNTRIRPDTQLVQVPVVETFYSYENQDGFGHALEMCNGAGVCRKKSGGTMCPSYQATLDERHSTRGRGNALRMAITGQSIAGGNSSVWDDQGTSEILDLCLSCKACKSECPSNVDIAKLKAEYTAQRYQSRGHTPLRSKIFARIHMLNRMASLLPSTTNALNKFPPYRSVLNSLLDIHPSRSLPAFAKPSSEKPIPDEGRPKILVLSDTFSTHNDPGITAATVRVLTAFGYAVGVKRVSDLGRSAISQGCLPEAIADAERMLDLLQPNIEDPSVIAMLVPEPSCLSAVCDDWKELKIDRPIELRTAFAEKAALPEVFLESFWGQHQAIPEFRSPAGSIKIHSHCHQSALWGERSAGEIFMRLFPERSTMLDTGCCGMAGSFGYSSSKYDLSIKIAEQRLFPAVRNASAEDVIVASGTSCRHQVGDGTERTALHAIELLNQLVIIPEN